MTVERPRVMPYGGYYRTKLPAEDAELTHVGRGTPCGEYLRRFWHPVALSAEIKDLPLAARILGEDLVLFRDGDGRVGLLHRHCSHRGTSLEYGIVSGRGIRCCYHGWLFDVDGTVLETPGEPPESRIRHNLVHGAYPARDHKGLVFAYMGPPAEQPEFPVYDAMEQPDNEMAPYSIAIPCNWLQVHENSMDPIHTVFLHTRVSGTQLADAWGAMPALEFTQTPIGMIYTTSRRWGDKVWVRSNDVIFPNIAQAAALFEDGKREKHFNRVSLTRWIVPIDDTHAMTIGWRHFNDRVDPGLGDRSRVGKEMVDFIGQSEDRPFEERQRVPGDYEAEASQRPIAIHGCENLGWSDRGVAMLRRLLRRSIRAVASGERVPPPRAAGGTIPTYAHDTVLSLPGEEDLAALAVIGRKVTDTVLAAGIDAGGQREAVVAAKLQDLARSFTPQTKVAS
jgi:nitrite reductase/ring-hydroxylating ferredoxin subunit